MLSIAKLPPLLRFKNQCDRGLQQQGPTCYFISTVNTFLLSDGLYRLALHRLNDFYEEIKSNPTLVKEWLDTKDLCLTSQFIEQLMINDIETLDDIVAQDKENINQMLTKNKTYDDFINYFKDKLTNYQRTEPLSISQPKKSISTILKSVFRPPFNSFDVFYNNFKSKWNNKILISNQIYITPSKETFLSNILDFTENRGNYKIARYAFYNIVKNYLCEKLTNQTQHEAITQMHHNINKFSQYTKKIINYQAEYTSLVFNKFLHIMYLNQYYKKVIKENILSSENLNIRTTFNDDVDIIIYKIVLPYEFENSEQYRKYKDALNTKLNHSIFIENILSNVQLQSEFVFDNAAIAIKFIDTKEKQVAHSISMVTCNGEILLIDPNYPDLINYGVHLDGLTLKNALLLDDFKPIILQKYNSIKHRFNQIVSITYDHICFIRRTAAFGVPIDIDRLRQKLCRLESQIQGGASFKKQVGKYVTHNGRRYCLYYGKHNKHYIQQKGQMVPVSELKLKPS